MVSETLIVFTYFIFVFIVGNKYLLVKFPVFLLNLKIIVILSTKYFDTYKVDLNFALFKS